MAITKESGSATRSSAGYFAVFRVELESSKQAIELDEQREAVSLAVMESISKLLKDYPDMRVDYRIEHASDWIGVI